MGTGVFMYVTSQIAHPVTVEIKLNPNWKSIATGLDPVSLDKPDTLQSPLQFARLPAWRKNSAYSYQ